MNYSREVSEFLRDTCQQQQLNISDVPSFFEMHAYPAMHPVDGSPTSVMPLVTGSTAEFCIVPMLPCIGDIDVMFYYTGELAIPEGHPPPTQLPAEFDSSVKVYEMKDSPFPGYVYLVLSYLLTKHGGGGIYRHVKCSPQQQCALNHGPYVYGVNAHGPARVYTSHFSLLPATPESVMQADSVKCMHSLVWHPQAKDWPKRYRKHGWPDSETIKLVISKGCDVVPVAHRLCKSDPWMSKHQWRLSFSRAEIVLLNSWTPLQQSMYHMLRVFVKAQQSTDPAAGMVSNYHIKTFMLWACELHPRNWWTAQSNLVVTCVYLLRHFGAWLSDGHCQHYFVRKCNLLHSCSDDFESTTTVVVCKSIREESLAQWFVDNYIRKCSRLCPDNAFLLFADMETRTQLQDALSATRRWKNYIAALALVKELKTISLVHESFSDGVSAQCDEHIFIHVVMDLLYRLLGKLSVHVDLDMHVLGWVSFIVPTVLHDSPNCSDGCYKLAEFVKMSPDIEQPDQWFLQVINMFASFLPGQCTTAVLTSKATDSMKSLSAKPYGPKQLKYAISASLYLRGALACNDTENDDIFWLANVYLAVLCYITGQYHTAFDHCALVTKSQEQTENCSRHMVDGKLLPKVDANIDNALGLVVLYQYVRATALNQRQQQARLSRHVGVFSAKPFAHYLTINCLLFGKYFPVSTPLTPSAALSLKAYLCQEIELYKRHMLESKRLFVSDLLVCKLPKRAHLDPHVLLANPPRLSELIQLLRQNSVEDLMSCRHVQEQTFGPVFVSCFEPLSLYRCCFYERCIRMCHEIAQSMLNPATICVPLTSITLFEYVQQMDSDLVSLFGLVFLANPGMTNELHTITISQLPLSLYLMTQCQLTLEHPVESLLQTVDLIDASFRTVSFRRAFDRPLLQLSRRKLVQEIIARETGEDSRSLFQGRKKPDRSGPDHCAGRQQCSQKGNAPSCNIMLDFIKIGMRKIFISSGLLKKLLE